MSKKIELILVLFVVLGVFMMPGCKKNNDIMSNYFFGSWAWVSTSGGIGGLHFEANNENSGLLVLQEDGRYEITAAGAVGTIVPTAAGFYNVSMGTSLILNKEVTFIEFDHLAFKMIAKIDDSGRLSLRDDVFDGFVHIYKKNK